MHAKILENVMRQCDICTRALLTLTCRARYNMPTAHELRRAATEIYTRTYVVDIPVAFNTASE